jgi:hypothetical protein
MFPFSEVGPFDHSEKKALLMAFVLCAVFIILLAVFEYAMRPPTELLSDVSPTPSVPELPEPSQSSFGEPAEMFRVVPANFSGVDFQNFSYGVYDGYNGTPVNLTLNEGKMWDASGWFNLEDVYYKDITGDGSPEAIVRLLHLRCNGSCDGGADAFYIYSRRNGKLKNIWRYETGSYAYGCGLRSFTLENKQMLVELFGRCGSDAMVFPGPRAFMVEDLTLVHFEFDGTGFKTKMVRYIPQQLRNVKNWKPEIRIY